MSGNGKGKGKGKKKDNGKAKEKPVDPYAYHRELNADEKKLVDGMRAKLKESEHKEDHKGQDVGELLRFLKARDFDLDKAFDMYSTHLKWKGEYKPQEIDTTKIQREIATGKFRVMPEDKNGNVTFVIRAVKHIPGVVPLDDTIRYGVYMVEQALKMLPKGKEQLNVVYDRTGFTRKNFDRALISQFAHVMEANYPERIGKILIYASDWLFNLLWKIVKPFMPTATVKKVSILNTSDLHGEMLKLYDEENLWYRMGGKWHDAAENTSEGDEKKKKDESSTPKDDEEAVKKEFESLESSN